MNKIPQFPFAYLGRRRNLWAVEYEALLDYLPQAVILADAQSHQIVYANTKAAELTSYAHTTLNGLHMETLISDWGKNLLENALRDPSLANRLETKLNRQTGEQIDVLITLRQLPPKGKRVLVVLEPDDSQDSLQVESARIQQFWDGLQELLSAPHETDLDRALALALQAGQALTHAGILAIYQASEQVPELGRLASRGEAGYLPERLPPQDLSHLRSPRMWHLDQRTPSTLHRAAHANHLTFLATAPLGNAKAAIGLVVAADRLNEPSSQILPILQALAVTITTIIQQHALISTLEEELARHKRGLAIHTTLQDAIQEGVIVLSPDLLAIKINPAAEMILGYGSSEVYMQPVENILIGTESIIPALTDAQQGSTTFSMGSLRLYRRNGEAFLANLRTLPVMLENSLIGIIILIQDLSEQEQIREQTQQLEQRAILGEVTAIFAHEVRNPINNISTGLQLMALNLKENDPDQEFIGRLQQDCDRLEDLMKSVLSFSRPTDYEMEIVDLEYLLQRLLERLHTRMARVNVQYHLQVEPGCPPIEGNPRALEQVFNNLINNALQAMSANGGRLALKIQRLVAGEETTELTFEREYVEVSVADTGPGIPKEIQERIFQPFFTTNRNGSGLGLAIAKRIITAHKGMIKLNSFPGGTVFYVQLPAANQQPME